MATCIDGLSLTADWFAPERFLKQKMSQTYANHPILSRAVTIPIATASGALKPFLFPIWALVGCVVFPILAAGRGIYAAVKGAPGDGGATKCLTAWSFCVLGVAVSLIYTGLSAYGFLPLIATSSIFVAAMSLSITIHVYQAVSAPPLINP